VPQAMAPAASRRQWHVEWPLAAYSAGTGVATAGLIALTARLTTGADGVVRLFSVMVAAVLTVCVAVNHADRSMRAVGAVYRRRRRRRTTP
jgi:hypothetical protein